MDIQWQMMLGNVGDVHINMCIYIINHIYIFIYLFILGIHRHTLLIIWFNWKFSGKWECTTEDKGIRDIYIYIRIWIGDMAWYGDILGISWGSRHHPQGNSCSFGSDPELSPVAALATGCNWNILEPRWSMEQSMPIFVAVKHIPRTLRIQSWVSIFMSVWKFSISHFLEWILTR